MTIAKEKCESEFNFKIQYYIKILSLSWILVILFLQLFSVISEFLKHVYRVIYDE